MKLAYRFTDDWLIYAQAEDGSWWCTITETWPAWGDLPDGADQESNAVERYMVPLVSAWNTELSPTAEIISGPQGLRWERWERVPDEYTHDLDRRINQ
jgi:hypothetical protein